jgi:hypothetical protein
VAAFFTDKEDFVAGCGGTESAKGRLHGFSLSLPNNFVTFLFLRFS